MENYFVNLVMSNPAIAQVSVKKVNVSAFKDSEDMLAIEEPLEIRMEYGLKDNRIQKNISVTMRTPGADFELASGFLYTEGIIRSYKEISSICHLTADENVVLISLEPGFIPETGKLDRNFYTTSSCGVCGKSSIDAIKTFCNIPVPADDLRFSSSLIYRLPDLLRQQQEVFESTGGLHASALFDTEGQLIILREDVGRHNALDKLIGASLAKNITPLDKYILLLSGRASFELIQKAAMAGIKAVAAVGAPSSLAVQMAAEWDITLIGFLRGERFNIYSGEQRILI